MTSVSIEDRLAVQDLIHQFYDLVDSGHADQVAKLFTADATMIFGPGSPAPGAIHGSAIADAMAARARQTHVTTRHVVSNIRYTPTGQDHITTRSILTFYRSDTERLDPSPHTVADIEEVFVRTEQGWLLCKRSVMPIFVKD